MILKKTGAYLREICLNGTGEPNSTCGYRKKYGYDPMNPPPGKKEDAERNLKRMDYELSVIMRTKYPSYFLCVWDFINWAKEHGIPVGAGRGSGAGSIVAYLSGITDIDPMKYDLLFERFLNPDRVSPPDFDTDFCERRRQEVIDYVVNKYGRDCVSQIGTYGQLKAKAVLKDVARAFSRTPQEANMITKLVPDDPKMTLKKAVKESPELKEMVEGNAWVKNIFDFAAPIEMLNRQMGIHACGVIISNHPLESLLPLGRGAHDEVITQYTAPLCESVGLLKMDFLGLRTLTLIQDTIDNIKKSRGIELDLDQMPLDDQATFDLLNRGDTVAVFQLESGGMQNLCRQFKVENIKHIIALVAIYRPGPMAFIPLFVGRKLGTIPIEYDHPLMEKYLKETYGIMLYQEQIMQVVQELAGFSLGQADILRRAIGKKKIKDMEAQHDKFIEGCAKTNHIEKNLAETIWENIKKFADYGFNKSHSAAYALLSYRTAYLKANFRPEFMAAVLTSELSNAEKLTFLINECRSSGIQILPPDVNSSDVNFTVDNGAIRFGLGAIKGFGTGVSQSIIEARKDGPFKDMIDLLERTEGLNSKGLESLIRSGAMDTMGLKRSQLIAMLEPSIAAANTRKRDKESGQGSLFDILGDDESMKLDEVEIPDIPEFEESEILDDEKNLLGFYVSGHPLSKYEEQIKRYSSSDIAHILQMNADCAVKFGGMIKTVVKKYTKTDNKAFAILQVEDLTGSIECICYNRTYERCKDILQDGAFVFLDAVTKKNDENSPCALLVNDIQILEQAIVRAERDLRELSRYEEEIKTYSTADALSAAKMPPDIGVKLGVLVKSVTVKHTRADNKEFAILQLQDFSGSIECICYNREYLRSRELLHEGNVVFIKALTKKNTPEGASTLVLQDAVLPILQVMEAETEEIHVHLHEKNFKQEQFDLLKDAILAHPGATPLILCVETLQKTVAFIETSMEYSVAVNRTFLSDLEQLLGSKCYKLKADPEVPSPRVQHVPE